MDTFTGAMVFGFGILMQTIFILGKDLNRNNLRELERETFWERFFLPLCWLLSGCVTMEAILLLDGNCCRC